MAEKSTHYPRLTRSSTISSSSSSSNYCSEDATKHEDLFVCLLCCAPFTQPRVLDCQHVFCETCLSEYAGGRSSINCPTCYRETPLGCMGAGGLKSCGADNPVLQRKVSVLSDGAAPRCDVCIYRKCAEEAPFFCPKCGLNLCVACRDVHEQQTVFRKHHCIAVANRDNVLLTCDVHYRMSASWLCADCQGPLVCSVCILLKHQSHRVEKLQNALTLRRDKIRSLLRKLAPLLDHAELELEAKHLKHTQKQSSLEKRCSVLEAPVIADEKKSSVRKVSQYNKYFNMVLQMLDHSQSKRLIVLHDDIVSRLQTILTHELLGQEKTRAEDDQTKRVKRTTDACNPPQPQLLFKPELIWKIEKQTKDSGDLWNPCAVAFLPDSCTVIAEYDLINDKNNRLRVFSADGKQFSIIGQGKVRPLGVTVNKEGKIFVTDCENKRVKIFNISGDLVGEIGKGQFGWPYGVAVNSRGQVIVSDAFNDTISIYGGDGKRTKLIGCAGNATDQLRSPFHVTVDSADNIYVADSGNNRVKMFNAEGCYIKSSSVSKCQQPGGSLIESKVKKLKSPRGVAIDMMGNLLITDDHSRVTLFNKELVYQQSLLNYKDGVKFPEAVATNDSGRLAVTEWNPNQMFAVKVYNIYG
jgi:hypothetical protein